MPLTAGPGPLAETAYAKVNLALHVRERRGDGYHALESLFVFAEFGDRLSARLQPKGEVSLTLDGPFGGLLDAGGDNLVIRAVRAMQAHIGEDRGVALALTKNLPVASGIGGGSADGAATLRLLTRLWDVKIAADELEAIALTLGSDVPACLASVTQMVRGRGEKLQERAVEGLNGMPMLLVNPGIGLSTAQVFAGWDQVDRGPLTAATLDELIASGRNDLEAPAIRAAPVIAEIRDALNRCRGVRLARMSGSGATCFALFGDAGDCHRAAQELGQAHPGWWVAQTRVRTI